MTEYRHNPYSITLLSVSVFAVFSFLTRNNNHNKHSKHLPIYKALENGDYSAAENLLNKGLNLKKYKADIEIATFMIGKKDCTGIKWLQQHDSIIDKTWMKAASEGDLNTIKTLTECGIDVNRVMDSNLKIPVFATTAFSASLSSGHYEISKYLMNHGADESDVQRSVYANTLTAIDKKNLTAIKALYNLAETPDSLCLHNTSCFIPLHGAVQKRWTKGAEIMLDELKVDVNALNQNNASALHIAAKTGFKPMVDLLIQHNINQDAHDCYNKTAADVAHMYEHYAIAKYLHSLPEHEISHHG